MDFVWISDVAMNGSIPIACFREMCHPPKSMYNSHYIAPLAKINFFSFSLGTVTKRYNTGPKKVLIFSYSVE